MKTQTPKEKVNEMVNELFERSLAYHDACIAVKYFIDEIIDVLDSDRIIYGSEYRYEETKFWEEAKRELELL